jgi:hypothetical protein
MERAKQSQRSQGDRGFEEAIRPLATGCSGMIVNTTIGNLLKTSPQLSPATHRQLEIWLRLLDSEDFSPVIKTQFEMIDFLVDLECRAEAVNRRRKEFKVQIPQLKAAGRIDQIRSTQAEVSSLEKQIDCLHYERDCVLLVGDTIASKMLDVDAIKQFAQYPSPGFISGKEGLEAEIEAARHFLRDGYLVLFNDLTHSLRLGDLTLVKDDKVRTFEVKSRAPAYSEPETIRQIVLPIGIHSYIERDVIHAPVKIPGRIEVARGMTRIGSGFKEDWHFNVGGALYKALRKSVVAQVRLGKKIYLATSGKQVNQLRRALEVLTESGHWVIGNVRKRVTDGADLPPFTRWFKPNSAVEIMSGELMVLSAFCLEDLVQLFAAKGVKATFDPQQRDLFPISLSTLHIDEQKGRFDYIGNVGDWQRERVLYSFLALESFVEICAFMISPEAHRQMMSKFNSQQKSAIPKTQ